MKDEEIVRLYLLRDEDAIAYTQQKYGSYLYTASYDLIKNAEDAEECVNDAYIAAWNSIPPHKPEVLRTYMCKLVRNITINRIRDRNTARRGGGQVIIALDELEDTVPGQTDDTEYAMELERCVKCFVKELSPDARRVFIDRYYNFFDIGTIAKKHGYSQSKVKMMLKRSRDALRKKLESEDLM